MAENLYQSRRIDFREGALIYLNYQKTTDCAKGSHLKERKYMKGKLYKKLIAGAMAVIMAISTDTVQPIIWLR